MSHKKSKSNKKPVDSTRLLTHPKYNYQSSDNGGNTTTTSTSVAGIGYSQYSDDNLSSEHHKRNKNKKPPDNYMYRTHHNPHLISNKFTTTDRHNRHYRRKKHKSKPSDHQHQPPNMPYPPYYPYPPYPPNTANPPTSQPYYPYPYPPPYPYPYPYPAVPAHGDVAITQSFTPPPVHQNRVKHGDKTDGHPHQMPPYYYYPSPYYAHGPPHTQHGPPHGQHDKNAIYPYNMNPYGHFVAPPQYAMPTSKRDTHRKNIDIDIHRKNIDIDTDTQYEDDAKVDDTKVENAEPADDDDINSRNKLFSDLGNDGYENDEVPNPNKIVTELFDTYNSSFQTNKDRPLSLQDGESSSEDGSFDSIEASLASETRTNCFRLCILLCDMENAFEVIEIIILLVFIAFIAAWWVDRENTVLLFSLAGCSSIFGLLVINMRRAQSSLRLHELGRTFNDFRCVLFTIGLCVVIAADQTRYFTNEDENIKYLWIAHSFVWLIAGMLWCTIDFAPYMSYFVSTSYHMFMFIGTILEFAKVCYQIWNPEDIPRVLYKHNGIEYTLYDFKIDGLLLMLMVEISTIITLMRDKKREWYCFGLSHVYRHRLLQISRRQERIANDRMIHHGQTGHNYNTGGSIGSSHLIHNISGNRYFYMFGSNEDSLLLIWIVNLGVITYLSFFVWDVHSSYKSIPAALGILAFIVLIYRECDFHLIPLMKQQTHFWFLLMGVIELWFVTIYSSIYIDRNNKDEMWKDIGSFMIDSIMVSMGMILIFLTDILISSVSSYFIIRGTIPLMMLSVSIFSSWYLSFNSESINKIKWPIAIIIRNSYYILITMCFVSIIKWIRDPIHKYFIYILDRRKRTMLYEHRYRDQHNSHNKLLFNDTRDHSITMTRSHHTKSGNTNISRGKHQHSSRSLLGHSRYDNIEYIQNDEQYQQVSTNYQNYQNNQNYQRLTRHASKPKTRSQKYV